jgi:hypothetical protein
MPKRAGKAHEIVGGPARNDARAGTKHNFSPGANEGRRQPLSFQAARPPEPQGLQYSTDIGVALGGCAYFRVSQLTSGPEHVKPKKLKSKCPKHLPRAEIWRILYWFLEPGTQEVLMSRKRTGSFTARFGRRKEDSLATTTDAGNPLDGQEGYRTIEIIRSLPRRFQREPVPGCRRVF